jgi:methylated-DNA-[protein]-cysteine S-methyltransferase
MNIRRWHSPLGPLWLAANNNALIGAWFEQQKHFPKDLPTGERNGNDPVLIEAQEQLVAYFGARLTRFTLPLAPQGTAFQRSVWNALLQIEHGAKSTYGAISTLIHQPSAARAVGAAVGRNPISIIIPCHRVLGAGGAMTGYAGGLLRKEALLKLESVGTSTHGVAPTGRPASLL